MKTGTKAFYRLGWTTRIMPGRSVARLPLLRLRAATVGNCGTTVAELTIPRPNEQRFPGARSCCDKNVIVPRSEPGKVDLNAAELSSGKRLKNQVKLRIFITDQNTLGDLQNRRATGLPVTGGFDPHSLPPFVFIDLDC